MFDELRKAWSRLRRQADWRALSDGTRPELDYDACILSQGAASGSTSPRNRVFEVYIRGQLVGMRHSLAEAKSYVDDRNGPGEWARRSTDPVKANHYYFGETEEFGPTIYYTRDL